VQIDWEIRCLFVIMTGTTSLEIAGFWIRRVFDLDYAMIDRIVIGLNAESFRSQLNVLNLRSHSHDKMVKYIVNDPDKQH
jgi:hypothetical protein